MSQLGIQSTTSNIPSNIQPTNTNSTDASSSSYDDFEVLDMPPTDADLGTNVFEGAEIDQKTNISKQKLLTLENLNIPPAKNTIASAIGRFFLSIVNFFKGVKSSDTLNTQEKIDVLRNKNPEPLEKLPDDTKPVSLSSKQLGKITGMGDNAVIRPFTSYNPDKPSSLQSILYPHGEPRLSDIKQDPELQDCWFLSSIASGLSSMGTKAISRLFSESQTPGNVMVRLGNNLYDVPLGRVSNGSNSFGSKSANWVVALENAMAMHLFATSTSPLQSGVNPMEKRFIGIGLEALFGYPTSKVLFSETTQAIAAIKELIQKNCAVVIGHGGSIGNAATDGIAPGHAVCVLDVNDDDSLTVLDPYGQVKHMKASSLDHCHIDYTQKTTEAAPKEILTVPEPLKHSGKPTNTANQTNPTTQTGEELLAGIKKNLRPVPGGIKG